MNQIRKSMPTLFCYADAQQDIMSFCGKTGRIHQIFSGTHPSVQQHFPDSMMVALLAAFRLQRKQVIHIPCRNMTFFHKNLAKRTILVGGALCSGETTTSLFKRSQPVVRKMLGSLSQRLEL